MSLSIERFDRNNRHGYDVKDAAGQLLAKDLVGITTILNVVDKSGGLVPWASRLVSDHFKEKIRAGISLNYHAEDLASLLDVDGYKIVTEKRDAAGDRGTDVHALCAQLAEKKTKFENLVMLPVDQVYMLQAFCLWMDTYEPEILSVERPLVCIACGYGATTDLECVIAGDQWVIDIKTGSTLQDTMALQLCAQAHALNYTNHRICNSVPGLGEYKLGVLWLGAPPQTGEKKRKEYPKDGCELIEVHADFSVVQAVLTAYRWRREGNWRA